MQEIEFTNLIITCEACGNVKRYMVRSQEECDRIFREFRCENSCGRNLSSFITLGTIKRESNGNQDSEEASEQVNREAVDENRNQQNKVVPKSQSPPTDPNH